MDMVEGFEARRPSKARSRAGNKRFC